MKIQLPLTAILLSALTLFGCAGPPTASDQGTTSSVSSAPVVSPEPAVKPQPIDVLKKMAAYLQSLDRFKVRVEKTTELILPSEERLLADQTVDVAVQKPNRLWANFQNLSGGRLFFYDGKSFSLYTPESNVYASVAAPPTIDGTLDLLQDRYQIAMPIADLLFADPQSRLVQNLKSETYVGRILVRGVVCHHLAFRTPEVDWEIWIEDGPRPLPRRLVLTDKSVQGSPMMLAALTDWDVAPTFAADLFTFNPPPNAEKISFLGEVPAAK